jgi:predicted permease
LPVLAFTTIVSVATGLLFGLAPAMALRTAQPHDQLRSGRASSTGRRSRSALALVQLALASVLLVGSSVVLTSLYRATQVDPGFNPDNVMTFRVTPPPATHADGRALNEFFQTLIDRLSVFGTVSAAGATSNLPMAGNSTVRGVILPGDPRPELGEEQLVLYQVSTPGYVEASGMRLLDGRDFTVADSDTSLPVTLINESMARMLWPDGRAVGRQILIFTDEDTPREVVGVLADIRYRGLDRPILPQYYVPFSQAPRRTMDMALRLNGALPLADVKQTVESIDASLPVYEVRTLDSLMRESLSERRALTTTISLFGALAVALAAIGLNGIVATGVRERRREIGIRMAVGATTSQVHRLFVKQGLAIAVVAVVTGVGASYWLVTWGQQQLVGLGLEPPSPALLTSVSLLILAIALVATWLPARHATRVDPVETLRDG